MAFQAKQRTKRKKTCIAYICYMCQWEKTGFDAAGLWLVCVCVSVCVYACLWSLLNTHSHWWKVPHTPSFHVYSRPNIVIIVIAAVTMWVLVCVCGRVFVHMLHLHCADSTSSEVRSVQVKGCSAWPMRKAKETWASLCRTFHAICGSDIKISHRLALSLKSTWNGICRVLKMFAKAELQKLYGYWLHY